MAENKEFKWFVSGFVVLILAIAFIASLATQTSTVTDKTVVSGESYNLSTSCYASGQVNTSNSACNYTVTNYPTGWQVDECPLTNVVVTNNTGTVLTLDTDYHLFTSSGVVQFLNTTSTNSTKLGSVAKVDYKYCGPGYLNSSWGRSVLSTNVGLYALAILIFIVGVVYLILELKKGREE